jgi:alpha,alpha-trehalase
MRKIIFIITALMLTTNIFAQQPLPPDKIYGQLFTDVQLSGIFPDGKTFVDCIPKRDPKAIVSDYLKAKNNPAIRFSLKLFVDANFDLPSQKKVVVNDMNEKDPEQHIKKLWSVLKREADKKLDGSSLLPLPDSYIVPGGRFREIYYWDSYFTMLGLKESGETQIIENMINNFSYLINTYGHIPNGNRSYYLSRSQPPFFSMMVDLLASIKGDGIYKTYLPALQKEYNYWMDKTAKTKHAVKMPDGSILNRYYDRDDIPRQESYKEDFNTATKNDFTKAVTGDVWMNNAGKFSKSQKTIFRHLRSGAESGWDFSSRWFADEKNISTIHTTDIIPVDLNCLLYNLEKSIAKGFSLNNDITNAAVFTKKYAARKAAVLKYCWNPSQNYFCDYNLEIHKQNNMVTAAGMYPLFTNIATPEQGNAAADVLQKQLLKPGGVGTTNNHTGQQWDAPNGWAPLQWVAVKGLKNYGANELAADAAQRWVSINEKVYLATGKMMEKYNVEDISKEAGGGEYPGQDGFGWTNGVYLAMKKMLSEPITKPDKKN